MFSRDEMQRAIEDALKSMEGVALELYRRGREEAREELETVKRERDEARAACPDCAMWAERSARWHDDMQRAERERDEARADAERYLADLRRCASEPYERTRELEALQAEVERLREMAHDFEAMREDRDEARAEVERVRKHYAASVLEHGKMLVEAVDSAKRQKSLADRAHDQACRLAAKLDARSTDQFRRGAEAMREACAQWVDHWVSGHVADKLRDMPIPEEP